MSSNGTGKIAILLGPPGVGKGTQGALLTRHTGLGHLSTGDLLRRHRKEGTELGRRAQGYMDRGELVPDELIVDMVGGELASLGPEEGLVFDGFPRTVGQAEALGPVLERAGRRIDAVVVLEADDEEIVDRLKSRRNCPSCGAVYNLQSNPPAREGTCDRCGDSLAQREDDRPETVRRRLEVYREETAPLIRYYQERGADMVFVDGAQTAEQVQADIQEGIGLGRVGLGDRRPRASGSPQRTGGT